MSVSITPLPPAPASATMPATNDTLKAAARKVEAGFLAEMLGYAGFGASKGGFGGGIGEEQFASFLRQAEAEKMVAHGGIGLAESLYHAMKERADGSR